MNYYLFEALYMRNITKTVEYYDKYSCFINKENRIIYPDAYVENDGISLFEENKVVDFLNLIDENLAPELLKNNSLVCLGNLNIVKKNIPGEIVKEKVVRPTDYNFTDYLNGCDVECSLKFNANPKNIKKYLENPAKLTEQDIKDIATAWKKHLERRFVLKEVPFNYIFNLPFIEKVRVSAFALVGGNLRKIVPVFSKGNVDFFCDDVKITEKNKSSIAQVFVQKEECND